MTNGAGRLIEVQLAGAVVREEPLVMARRLKDHRLGVASGATVGRVDLSVADQAIGHLRQRRPRHRFALFHPAMAGGAWRLCVVEVAADVAGRGQVGLVVDRTCNQLRDVAELQM